MILYTGGKKKNNKKKKAWESPGGAAGKSKRAKAKKLSEKGKEKKTAPAQFPKQRLEHLTVSPGEQVGRGRGSAKAI